MLSNSERITLNWQILRVKRTCQDATAQRDSVYFRNHLKGYLKVDFEKHLKCLGLEYFSKYVKSAFVIFLVSENLKNLTCVELFIWKPEEGFYSIC